jgi:hypothetical protein
MDMTTNPLPAAIRRTQYAVFAVAAIHVAALLLILTHGSAIRTGQASLHPGGDLDTLARAALVQLALPHLLFAVLLPIRARRLAHTRAKSRVVLTVVLAVQIASSAMISTTIAQLPGCRGWIIALQAVSLVFELSALAFLWSGESRAWFRAAAPAPETREAVLAH